MLRRCDACLESAGTLWRSVQNYPCNGPFWERCSGGGLQFQPSQRYRGHDAVSAARRGGAIDQAERASSIGGAACLSRANAAFNSPPYTKIDALRYRNTSAIMAEARPA